MAISDTFGLTIRVSFQPGIEPFWTCSRWLNPEYLKLTAKGLRRLVVEPHGGLRAQNATPTAW